MYSILCGVVLQDALPLRGWTSDTLDGGCYTFGSDVYQIGVMSSKLFKHKSQDVASDAVGLLQMLKSKVPANEALKHAWLHT